MITPTLSDIRIFLHVIAACVWIGGQIALATVVPVLRRRTDRDTTRAVARQFQRVAWPAFGVLIATGVWNLFSVHVGDQSSAYLTTLMLKLTCVALSGIGAAVHSLALVPAVSGAADPADTRRKRAISGAMAGIGLLFGLGAAFLGVLL